MSQRDFAVRLRSGFTDFKGIGIPPTAPAFVLTDVDTGTKYLVSFNTDGFGVQRISIQTVYRIIEIKEGVRVYEAGDGPYMVESGSYRLIIRGGRLAFLYDPLPFMIKDQDQALVYSRTETAQRALALRFQSSEQAAPLLVRIGMSDG